MTRPEIFTGAADPGLGEVNSIRKLANGFASYDHFSARPPAERLDLLFFSFAWLPFRSSVDFLLLEHHRKKLNSNAHHFHISLPFDVGKLHLQIQLHLCVVGGNWQVVQTIVIYMVTRNLLLVLDMGIALGFDCPMICINNSFCTYKYICTIDLLLREIVPPQPPIIRNRIISMYSVKCELNACQIVDPNPVALLLSLLVSELERRASVVVAGCT